ncbi:P-loop containing nucleoside triphosphate hydrolase protein [Mycena leptocephala]|nr:P-loop containing nucleoside triphosphate hydrolase protein [Mycena leptocephala]KAJ7844671.1 P-loop containing nucleoside triphosphate hydrolase protein [Mycena leptocephala]
MPAHSPPPHRSPLNKNRDHPSDDLAYQSLIFNAKTIRAATESLPFPYLQGVFGAAVFLLETVQKVQKNRDSMKELCTDTLDIITVIRDRIGFHRDTTAIQFQTQCEELERRDVVETVHHRQLKPRGIGPRLKEVLKSDSTSDEISRFRERIREVRANFMANVVQPQVSKPINNCPPPTRIFHGRRTILDKMHQYFSQNTTSQDIFVLHGLGGSGKTQIALKFIQEANSQYLCSLPSGFETELSYHQSWKILITSRNPGLCVYAGAHYPVMDMEEVDAIALLLRSAAKDATNHNKKIAANIVKVLHYLPLAIIQAGAFIAKTGNIDSYLGLYNDNKARLLTERPAQSHDNYAWTVYTTWQVSFDQLCDQAKTILRLCSFLHYQGISEDIFKNAVHYRFEPSGPSKEALELPLKMLSDFLRPLVSGTLCASQM